MNKAKANATSFTSESRKKIKPRGKAKKTIMLKAIRDTCKTEHEFLKKVIKIGLGENGNEPNATLLSLAINRIEPPLRAVFQKVHFTFDENSTPHSQASQILYAASKGEISPDVAALFINSVRSMLEIENATDIKDRLEKLESDLNID